MKKNQSPQKSRCLNATKTKTRTIILAAFTALPAATNVAQHVVSVPEGYVTVNIAPGTISVPSLSTFSIPLRVEPPPSITGHRAGFITALTATTITCGTPGWTVGSLASATNPSLIRIKSGGTGAGLTLLITANTATTATVSTPVDLTTLGIPLSGPNRGRYELLGAETLKSFFGSGNITGTNAPLSAGSAASADIVRVHDGTTFREFYYNSVNDRWQEGAFNRDNFVIMPDMGISYIRKAPSAFSFAILGRAPDVNLRVAVNNSGSTYINYPFPADTFLINSQIHLMPGWLSATSPSSADNILIWDGSGWRTYFYHSSNNRWQEGLFARNTLNIPTTRAIWVVKRGTAPGKTIWNFSLPYSLAP